MAVEAPGAHACSHGDTRCSVDAHIHACLRSGPACLCSGASRVTVAARVPSGAPLPRLSLQRPGSLSGAPAAGVRHLRLRSFPLCIQLPLAFVSQTERGAAQAGDGWCLVGVQGRRPPARTLGVPRDLQAQDLLKK